jgi:hypothetical protein
LLKDRRNSGGPFFMFGDRLGRQIAHPLAEYFAGFDSFTPPFGASIRNFAWRKNVTGIVQGPLPFFWGVSKTV